MRMWIVIGMFGFGCAPSANVVTCDDGMLCAAGLTCLEVQPNNRDPLDLCVSTDQQEACDPPLADGSPCNGTDGTCHGGACLDNACGNGLLDRGEACDDGNTAPNDGCSADCLSTEICGDGIVDRARGEECDDAMGTPGFARSHDGCSSQCTSELDLGTTLPIVAQPRSYAPLVFDAGREQVVRFGGFAFGSGDRLNDLAAWDGLRWSAPTPTILPEPRLGSMLAYDQEAGVVVMFGGAENEADTWTWNGSRWSLADVTTHPPAIGRATGCYDEALGEIVMFGGHRDAPLGTQTTVSDETWVWRHGDWAKIATDAAHTPPGREQAAMAYDPVRRVTVLFGGETDPSTATLADDVWEFDGTGWTQKIASSPVVVPRFGAAMAFDPVGQRMLVIGGSTFGSSLVDAYSWDGTAFTPLGGSLVPPMPATPNQAPLSATTDTVRKRLVLVDYDSRLLEFDGASWYRPRYGDTTVPPPPPQSVGMALDTDRHEWITFGGKSDASAIGGDTLGWSGTWRKIASPVLPPPRYGAAMAYMQDATPANRHVVMFGGFTDTTNPTDVDAEGVTWKLVGDAWQKLTLTPAPKPRAQAMMAYDPVHHEVVLFGGASLGAGSSTFGDTWLWNGTQWQEVTPSASPPARDAGTLVYDPSTSMVLLFGGEMVMGRNVTLFGDTWGWDGTTWHDLTTARGPTARAHSGMALDRARAALVLVGGLGEDSTVPFHDTWEWGPDPAGGAIGWRLVDARGFDDIKTFGRFAHIVASDPLHDGVLVFGGTTNFVSGDRSTITRLRYESLLPEADERCVEHADLDADAGEACADPDCLEVCAGCGDGTCAPDTENCETCSADCGVCP